MTRPTRATLFALFFASGAAGLVDQVVWTRLAFASFGIIAPVLSVVLSVFMLGLAVGSWAGGRVIGPLVRRTGRSAAVFYAAAEVLIGVGAVAVPALFTAGERLLLPTGTVDSTRYLASSAAVLAAAVFPWCLCMGATFPFMMAHVRERDPAAGPGSFGRLYLANVLGAMTGTLVTAVALVELLGFRGTLWVSAATNVMIAAVALRLGTSARPLVPDGAPVVTLPAPVDGRTRSGGNRLILFTSGFASMAMEVVWTRAFSAVLKTQVYSFALIVFAYLAATAAGSWAYRLDVAAGRRRSRGAVLFWLALAALLPAVMDDPRYMVQLYRERAIDLPSAALLLASIAPMCGLLGYLTPWLVDEESAGGNPRRAGAAYAVNVLGCILGPLVACYGMLPTASGRWAMIGLAGLFVACWAGVAVAERGGPTMFGRAGPGRRGAVLAAALAYAALVSEDFEEKLARLAPAAVVRRDAIASVVSFGRDRSNKGLLVNGFGMTVLTPITKFVAHLPLALHVGPPRSALVICFGMGTSYRSALTWGVDTTAVELVPSVVAAFGFYHADAATVLADPRGRIVVDDGRRFLARCGRRFDVITVDPPPPVEAAGSSLLFSTEFYALARAHLNPGGVVQMWYPGRLSDATARAVLQSMVASFPHVRCFASIDAWGMHMVGSDRPIDVPSADALAARLPPAARADLLEWADRRPTVAAYLLGVTGRELSIPRLLGPGPNPRVTDDRPFNEYYLLRVRPSREARE